MLGITLANRNWEFLSYANTKGADMLSQGNGGVNKMIQNIHVGYTYSWTKNSRRYDSIQYSKKHRDAVT